MECPRQVGGFLTRHRIHDQQHFIGAHGFFDLHQLRHHRLVDLQPSCRVDNHRIDAVGFGFLNPLTGNLDRAGIAAHLKHGYADLLA